MRTTAVLPVKSFTRAKQRFSAALPPQERSELAAAMVGDVLDALARVAGLYDIVVVTRDPDAALMAERASAWIVDDPTEAGHVPAALAGIARAVERGAQRVLLVPGDCPALDPAEISELLTEGGSPEVVIVADRHGTGTNALLLAPPSVMEPSFGPGSFERHRALARSGGVPVRVAAVPSLALDVDTFDDLETLLAARPHAAPRTRAVVAARAA